MFDYDPLVSIQTSSHRLNLKHRVEMFDYDPLVKISSHRLNLKHQVEMFDYDPLVDPVGDRVGRDL